MITLVALALRPRKPKVQRSGTTTTFSFGVPRKPLQLKGGVLSGARTTWKLSEFRHAGLALVPTTLRSRAGLNYGENKWVWRILMWQDSKTVQQVGPDYVAKGGGGGMVDACRTDQDAIRSMAQAEVALVLDKAIASTRLEPAPALPIGSYLPPGAKMVWIPALGTSIPV